MKEELNRVAQRDFLAFAKMVLRNSMDRHR